MKGVQFFLGGEHEYTNYTIVYVVFNPIRSGGRL